jgi:hypothetical protein
MRVLVVSDIHYASPGEQQRRGYEAAAAPAGWRRTLLQAYRSHVWLRDPFAHNGLLDRFLSHGGPADLVVANGDFSCDSAFVGVSDDAAAESAQLALTRLRETWGEKLRGVIGDHELGKVSLVGGKGGLRMASWRRATAELGLEPFWRKDLGSHIACGLCSSLLALPVYLPESLPEEREAWRCLRQVYIRDVERQLLAEDPDRPLLLFLHDPTALPFLASLPAMQARLPQVAATVIGHLHSPLVFWKSRLLAGLPPVRMLGHAVRRMTEALSQARTWRPFRVHLCPSLAGIELLKDGGYLELSSQTPQTLRVLRHRISR